MPDQLAEALLRYTKARPGESPFMTPIDGLAILRSDHPKPPTHMISKPALCIVAQAPSGRRSAATGSCRTFSFTTTECDERFVSSFEQHAGYRQREAPQESPEGHWRTLEYTIGNQANQHITQEKAGNDGRSALATVLVHNAVREPFGAGSEETKIEPGEETSCRKTRGGNGAKSP